MRRTRAMDNLRPLKIRLADPAHAGALLAFLRGRACVAEQVGPSALDVWPPPLLHEGFDRPSSGDASSLALDGQDVVACSACGWPIEETLSRLGSPRCHDCRDEGANGRALGAPLNGDARFQLERARVELQAYLRAWRAENGNADAAVMDY